MGHSFRLWWYAWGSGQLLWQRHEGLNRLRQRLRGYAKALRLDISDNTTVIPDNVHTRMFASIANQLGIPMKVDTQGVDIGVGSSAASRRATKK